MNVSVAMATFNGEKYIQEQLKSLAGQTHKPYELVVCDDGSADATLSIVDAFSRKAPFPVRIHRNDANLGYPDNFLKAAKLCKGDWVAFCDQDDVWLPNKLKRVAGAVEGNSELVMVLQNAELCDDRLNHRGRIFPGRIKPGIYGPNSQYGFWVWPGFLKTVKAEVFAQIDADARPPSYFPDSVTQSHDKWTCMLANALGGICVLGEPAVLYRRHESALTGSYSIKPLRERVKESRSVGADHYRFLEEVASASSDYLNRKVAETANPRWRDSFSLSAQCFERLSIILRHRAALYESEGIVGRATHYLCIWRKGGYLGPRFTAMGGRSALKDATRALIGS
jgi:glycosyltransferase involved in cell wall biosynthesis